MAHIRISDLTVENKPRERLLNNGAEALSDQELLAILLSSGTKDMNVIDLANYILRECGGLAGLRKVSTEDLLAIPGIGPAKAASLLGAIELGRRFSKAIRGNDERTRVNCAQEVYDLMHYDMENLDHEELRVLSLDTKHFLLSDDLLYKGTINSSQIRIAEILRRPLMLNAACFVMVHNHPSGDPSPSAADIVTTRNVMEVCKKIDMKLLDHVIIGSGNYVSVLEFLV